MNEDDSLDFIAREAVPEKGTNVVKEKWYSDEVENDRTA